MHYAYFMPNVQKEKWLDVYVNVFNLNSVLKESSSDANPKSH